MHLAEEVICQAAIVIKAREVCATDVAHLQLLVAGWTRGVGERFKLALLVFLLNLQQSDAVELLHSQIHCSLLTQNLHLGQPSLNTLLKFLN